MSVRWRPLDDMARYRDEALRDALVRFSKRKPLVPGAAMLGRCASWHAAHEQRESQPGSFRKDGCAVAAKCCCLAQFRSQFPPPDRSRIRNTQNFAPDFPVISETSKKRTKSRSQQLWREWGVERAKWPRRPQSQSSGLVRKARRYWAFEGPADAAESFCIGANGGEGGIRTHGTLARTTVFETVPIDHSGTSPRSLRPPLIGA